VISITAIVPTHGRPEMLGRALRSIASQEAAAEEVIVVDDVDGGPTAATRTAAGAAGLANVRIVSNARDKGPSGARNTGATLANGDLLAFLDDDDEWPSPYLKAARERFDSEGLDMVCADLRQVLEDQTEGPGRKAPERLLTEIFLTRNSGLIGSNLIMRRALFAEIGGFDESLPTCEDMDFAVRASLLPGLRYAPLHNVFIRHHEHGGARQCLPRGAEIRAGVRRFYELHRRRMTAEQQQEFRDVMRRWWGVDECGRDIDAPDLIARPWLK
jgi:GT2 family glycosyltransferase